ncbi:MAG: hypothetical protein ACRD3O_16860 [Terriglobia bacterium]
MRKLGIIFIVLCAGAVASCSRMHSKSAVEAAIEDRLHANPHLMSDSFSTHFEKVGVNGNTAVALVRYQSKAMPKLAVDVHYTLKLKQGHWQVVSRSTDAGVRASPANPHAGARLDQMPPPQSTPAPIASH